MRIILRSWIAWLIILSFGWGISAQEATDVPAVTTPTQIALDEVITGEFTDFNQMQELRFTIEDRRTVQFMLTPVGTYISGGGQGFSFQVFLPSGAELDYPLETLTANQRMSTYFQLREIGEYIIILNSGRAEAAYEFVINSRLAEGDSTRLEGMINSRSERFYFDVAADAGDVLAITAITNQFNAFAALQNDSLQTDTDSAGNLNPLLIERINRDGIYTGYIGRTSSADLTFRAQMDVLIQKVRGTQAHLGQAMTITEPTTNWVSAKPGDYFGIFGTTIDATVQTPSGEILSLTDGTFIADAYGVYHIDYTPLADEATVTLHRLAEYVLDLSPISVRLHRQQETIQFRTVNRAAFGLSLEINHRGGSAERPFLVRVEQNGILLASYQAGQGSRSVSLNVSLDRNSEAPVTVTVTQEIPSDSEFSNVVTISTEFFSGGSG